jgi:hypothetical protein
MPLIKERCSGNCGCVISKCPECEGTMVTPRDNPERPTPNELIDYGDGEEITYRHVCWECGWGEEVTVTVERSEYSDNNNES